MFNLSTRQVLPLIVVILIVIFGISMVMDADWRGAPTTDVAAVASKPPSPIKAIVTQQKTAPIKTTTLTTATPPEPSTPKPPKTSTTPNPAPVVPVVVTPANPLASVQTWVSYYAADQISKLSAFDLVEIDTEGGTDNYTQSDVKQLKDGGVIVVSYLNVGACETFRSYWKQCEKFKLAPYEGYPGEYWMDVTKSDYHTLLITAAEPTDPPKTKSPATNACVELVALLETGWSKKTAILGELPAALNLTLVICGATA